jgi:myo-inositol-1(or 4)-monophosphatase
MNEIAEYQKVCEQAVRAAGAMLVERMGHVKVREKGPADLVTEADLASQEMVRQAILKVYPDHTVLGEEGPPAEAPRGSYRWILDPLDGTTNYVHGYPFFAVSLALERDRELLVGAVFNPIAQECFTAAAGQGAFLNGVRIATSGITELSQAVASAGLPALVQRESPDLEVFIEASQVCQSIRRSGSAALNLAFVACGRMDVFWSFSTKVWDVAAGALLVREAGGTISSPDGTPYRLQDGRFLAAASPALHTQFRQLIQRATAAKERL